MKNRIRVNRLNIGWMASDGEDRIQRDYHGAAEDWLDDVAAEMPFGRLLAPEEVAKAVSFLLSADAGMMTGAVVPFDQSVWGAYQAAPPIPDGKLVLWTLLDGAVVACVKQARRSLADRLNPSLRQSDPVHGQGNLTAEVVADRCVHDAFLQQHP